MMLPVSPPQGTIVASSKDPNSDIGLDWELDNNGVLTLSKIEGTDGVSYDYNGKKEEANYYTKSPLYKWKDKVTSVVIKEGVTYLGHRLLRDFKNIKTVQFPASLKVIESDCFRACTGITEIVLPEQLEKLARTAFFGCTSLKKVVLNGTYTNLWDKTFSGCTNLSEIVWNAPTTAIHGDALKDCQITTIKYYGTKEQWAALLESKGYKTTEPGKDQGELTCFTDNLKNSDITVICSDGTYTYKEENTGDGNTEVTEIANGVVDTVIWTLDSTGKLTLSAKEGTTGVTGDCGSSGYNFDGYQAKIETVEIKDGVTVLGKNFFRSCTLVSISFPETLTTISENCFRSCTNLKELVLPNSLQTLARTAFYQCSSLIKVTINGTFTDIMDKTFMNCTSLEEIVINAPITVIHGKGFNGDAKITTVKFNGTVAQWITLLSTPGYETTEKAYVKDGVLGKDVSGVFTPLVKDSTTGPSTLMKNNITVTCNDGEYIYGKNYTENGLCWNLTDAVLTIEGTGAIPDYEAGKAPWYESASSITMVVLYDGITSVGENAFYGCSNIISARYAGTQEQWNALKAASKSGNDALFNAEYGHAYNGSAGENVTWSFDPETGKMTISGTGAMDNYEHRKYTLYRHLLAKVKTLVIEDGITSIGSYAFNSMAMTSVSFPNSLEILGSYAFGKCTGLTEVVVPEGVTIIGSKTFTNCSFTKLTLPSTVKYIDMKCFASTPLADVYYNGTKADWALIEISSQAQGNATLLDSNIHYQDDVTIDQIASDVAANDWYADHILYLYNNGLLNIENKTVSPAETNNLNWLLNVLYIRAGQSGQYEGATDWAISNGIIENDDINTVSLSDLALILYRTAVYNGQAPAGGDKAALGWLNTQNYNKDLSANVTDLDNTRALTRGEVASVLASYLGSEAGTADRDDVILAELKAIIENGGDNKMHIVSLDAPSGAKKAGDSTLIIFPNGELMLIDALTANDENWSRLEHILDALGITTIDYLVNSHPHSDHVGNFVSILEYIYSKGGSVKNFYAAYTLRWTGSALPVLQYIEAINTLQTDETKKITCANIYEGTELKISGVTINIYAPSEEYLESASVANDEAQNNTSMVMKFTYGSSTYLTCGDIYFARERYLVETYGEAIQADVIKLNHHGAYTSNSMDWIHATDAKIMFAPSDDIGDSILMGAVSAEGRAYYSNGCDGLIHISMDAEANYEVETRFDSANRSSFVLETEEPGDDGNNDNNGSDGNNGNIDNGNGSDDNKDNEKTGDNTPVMLMTAIAVLSLCASAWILVLNKKQRMF